MSRIAYLTGIEFGPSAIASLAEATGEFGMRRPLLVADKGVLAAGLVARATAHLPTDTPVFLDTPPNPTESAVLAALAMYKAEGCDGIVALGVYLSLDGPLMTIKALIESYATWPVGGFSLSTETAEALFIKVGDSLGLALRAAAVPRLSGRRQATSLSSSGKVEVSAGSN